MDQETLTFLKWAWPIVTGGLVVPLIGWFKTKYMNDVPIQAAALVLIVNIGLMYIIKYVVFPTVPFIDFYQLLTTSLGTGMIVHAGLKTMKKNGTP